MLLASVATGPASDQFPRVGLSPRPDHYEPYLDVHGQVPFEVYMIVLPAEGNTLMEHEYRSFNWAVLEACCGGAASIVGESYNPACQHDGTAYGGVVTTVEECVSGEVLLLCTLTLQMVIDEPGSYYVIAGPLALAYDLRRARAW